MNNRFKALSLSGLMLIASFVAKPVLADEWNKRTDFQFSGPVEIPGKVLTAGKYVFQLADSQSDRNIVQVFSVDSSGHERLVATILAIPNYTENTPDKPVIHFEERAAGAPEAIHSWFYPGDNTGWEFVYPKEQGIEARTNMTPAPTPAPVAVAAAPSRPQATRVRELTPATEVDAVQEEVAVAPDESPATTVADTDATDTPEPVLPETGGHSALVLLSGLTMFFAGVLTRLSTRRKAQS